jgi:hypothetical protein
MPLDVERIQRGSGPNAWQLFVVFARFEFAMKWGGFRRTDKAEAAWWTLADELDAIVARRNGARFFDEACNLAPEIMHQAPQLLVLDGTTGVRWAPAPVPHDSRSLLDAVAMVRNNLFHGDKLHREWRDQALIAEALSILELAFDLSLGEARFQNFHNRFWDSI